MYKPGLDEPKNGDPDISLGILSVDMVEMIKAAPNPVKLKIINAPSGLTDETFPGIFGLEVKETGAERSMAKCMC